MTWVIKILNRDFNKVKSTWNGSSWDQISETDFNKWIRVNTTDKDVGIQMLDGLVITDANGLPTDTPVIGTVRFDDTTNILYIYNGSGWVSTTLT